MFWNGDLSDCTQKERRKSSHYDLTTVIPRSGWKSPMDIQICIHKNNDSMMYKYTSHRSYVIYNIIIRVYGIRINSKSS